MKIPNYISSDEKRKAFGAKAYRIINTKEDFDEWYVHEHNLHECVFRGVKEACYKNYTSAQRHHMVYDLPGNDTTLFIEKELNQLRTLMGGFLEVYCNLQALPCTDLYLLSLAQHNSGATPLLDFSQDLKTALYFMSLEAHFPSTGADSGDLQNYASLYLCPKGQMTSLEQMLQSSARVMNYKKDVPYEQIHAELAETCIRVFSHRMFSHSWRAKYVLIENKPYIVKVGERKFGVPLMVSNMNIVAQQGCFVYSDRDLLPMEKGLGCLDIHKSLIPYIIEKYLDTYTQLTMFPDLDAIAQKAVFNAMAEL